MNLVSLEEPLADSHAFGEIAKAAQVDRDRLRFILAELGDMDAAQVVRMCGTAAKQRREARKKR